MSFPILPRIFIVILLQACLRFPDHVSGKLTEPRIIGGEICNAPDYPFVVAIFGPLNCGGSLITLEWVLTAAHCLRPHTLESDGVMIRSGFHAASNLIQIRYGKKAVVHKKFDAMLMDNEESPELRYDIGMLLADKPFKKGIALNPIPLPKPGFTKSCKVGTVLGIGVEHIIPYARGQETKPLKCVDLTIVNKTVCKKTYESSVVDDTIVCTMEKEAGKDACYGDSGGPLVCHKTIIGVVSYGRGCGNAGLSATYTKIESYLGFIQDIMSSVSKKTNKSNKAKKENTSKSLSNRKKSSLKLLFIVYLFMKNLF